MALLYLPYNQNRVAHTEKVSINNLKLQIQIGTDADLSVYREIFLDRDYQILSEIIKNATLPILDIGGHIGLFSLYAHALNPTVSIFTFEPDEGNFAALKAHLKLNHIQNVYPKNIAIAGTGGARTLYLAADSHNHSIVTPNQEGVVRKVSAATLADLFARHGRCSLVKMDCEGAEFEIFAATPVDQLKYAGVYYIEYHKSSPSMLICALKNAGFSTRSEVSRYDASMGFIFAKNEN